MPPDECAAVSGWFCGLRQAIETVNGRLDDTLGLKFSRARSYWGVLTRLAAKVVTFNISVLINQLFDRPPFASLNPLQLQAEPIVHQASQGRGRRLKPRPDLTLAAVLDRHQGCAYYAIILHRGPTPPLAKPRLAPR